MPKVPPAGVRPPDSPKPTESPVEGKAAPEAKGPQLKGFDALAASDEVADIGGDAIRKGGPVPIFLGNLVVNLGRATLVTEPETLEIDPGTEAGLLRTATLGSLAGGGGGTPRYEERRSEHALHGGGGGFFPAGPLGYGYLAGRHTKGIAVKVVSLKKTDDDKGIEAVPATAEALRALAPGESVAITGETKTKLFGGTMKCHLDEDLSDGSWVAGGPFGVEVGIDHEGVTTTEVLRGEEDAARLLLREESDKMVEGSGGIHVGIYLSWGLTAAYEIARRLKGSADTASEMATMPVWREHTSGIFVGAGKGGGRRCLVDVRLDLSRPGAQKAYEAAMRGDLDVARAIAGAPGSGVEIPFSAETEIRRTVIPVSLGLFGFGADWEKSDETRTTRAVLHGKNLEQNREIKAKSRSLTDFTLRRTSQMVATDHAEVSSPTGDHLPYEIDEERDHVTWTSGARDWTTSREEILGEIDLVHSIMGDKTPPEMLAFREKVAALEAHRFGKIGPRNEAGSTEVDLTVTLAANGLARLATMDEVAIYKALAEQHAAARGEASLPEWADQSVREAYDRESSDGRLEWKEMSPRYLAKRQRYFDVRRLVRSLQGLAELAPEARGKAVRDLIGTGGESRRNLGVLAELLAPDGVAIELRIDSNLGEDGAELDFEMTHAGRGIQLYDPLDPKRQGYKKPRRPMPK